MYNIIYLFIFLLFCSRNEPTKQRTAAIRPNNPINKELQTEARRNLLIISYLFIYLFISGRGTHEQNPSTVQAAPQVQDHLYSPGRSDSPQHNIYDGLLRQNRHRNALRTK